MNSTQRNQPTDMEGLLGVNLPHPSTLSQTITTTNHFKKKKNVQEANLRQKDTINTHTQF